MDRLLLVESSRTLRGGMTKLLARKSFDVLALTDADASAATIDRELAAGLTAAVIGWTAEPAAHCHEVLRRLGRADCRHIALIVLVHDRDAHELKGIDKRPFTRVVPWPQHAEIPRRMRSLVTQVSRESHERAQAKRGLRVLLVDDSRTSRTQYQRLLKRQGHTIVTCEHAEAALEVVARESFDLAIIDYHMPGMNGAMLCRALRALPATQDLTLAILTGSYEEAVIRDCLSAGAAECMFKTEPDELFVARVQSMAGLREREIRLDGERARLDSILASVGDGVFGVDRAGVIGFVNPAALRLLKYSQADDLVGSSAQQRIHGADARGRPIAAELSFLQQAYELGDSLSDWETTFWRADAQPLAVECTVRPLNRDGQCVGAVIAFRDIGERKRLDDELQWRAHHDHLTQLCNRQHFEDVLDQEIVRLKRSREHSALLFIDLDRFKHINDSAGHAAGDALLVSIGQKLKDRLRQSDLAARLGGDEFAVLLRNVDDAHVNALADEFRVMLVEMRFTYQGREFDVSGSVGFVTLDRKTPTPAHALNCADAACQIAKRQGRNQVHRFDATGDAAEVAASSQSWIDRLKEALAANAFAMQFQQIIDLRTLSADALDEAATGRRALAKTATVYGHEVLLRLADSNVRLAPRAFLPSAERFELLPLLDRWVLDHLAKRLAERALPRGMRLHVNIAAASLLDADYRLNLSALLRAGRFARGQLCLELKSSDAISLLQPLHAELAGMTQLGLQLVLDEFGRGFGDVGVLDSLPFTCAKLDADVVQTLTDDARGAGLLHSLTELAHAMRLVVIAPRIESIGKLAALRSAGVDCVQGFALGALSNTWPASVSSKTEPRARRAAAPTTR